MWVVEPRSGMGPCAPPLCPGHFLCCLECDMNTMPELASIPQGDKPTAQRHQRTQTRARLLGAKRLSTGTRWALSAEAILHSGAVATALAYAAGVLVVGVYHATIEDN